MSALRDPRFRRLLAGQALSGFGNSALYLSLAIWAKDLTGSNGAAGVVFLALGSASLLAPAAGYLVDRVRQRRRLLMTTDALTALVVLCLLFVHSREEIWLIYVVAFGYGLAANIVGPATSALLKDMLADDDLASSNALRQTVGQGLRLLSPVVGAALYAATGGAALAWFDAATFLASIAAVASVRVTESLPEDTTGSSLRKQVQAGFAHLYTQPVLRRISVASALAMLAVGFYESADFAVVAALGRPTAFFGTLMSVQAAGSIAAGFVVTRVLRRVGEARVVGLGLGCFGIGAAGMIVDSMALVCAAVVVVGVGVTFFAVGLGTALQRLTPPRLQGRVGAASFVLTDLPQTLSIGVGAALISVLDYRVLLAVLVVVTLASAATSVRSCPPDSPVESAGCADESEGYERADVLTEAMPPAT